MRIVLGSDAPRLEEPDDFTSFSVTAPGRPDADVLADRTASLGRADGTTHVFVEPFALVHLAAGRGREARWLDGLSKMVAYARSQGWVDEREAIRAHVVWHNEKD